MVHCIAQEHTWSVSGQSTLGAHSALLHRPCPQRPQINGEKFDIPTPSDARPPAASTTPPFVAAQ